MNIYTVPPFLLVWRFHLLSNVLICIYNKQLFMNLNLKMNGFSFSSSSNKHRCERALHNPAEHSENPLIPPESQVHLSSINMMVLIHQNKCHWSVWLSHTRKHFILKVRHINSSLLQAYVIKTLGDDKYGIQCCLLFSFNYVCICLVLTACVLLMFVKVFLHQISCNWGHFPSSIWLMPLFL